MAQPRTHLIGRILIYVVAAMLLLSGIAKFVAPPELVANFKLWHLDGYLTLIAVLEVGAVGLLLFPATFVWGLLACSGYLGGAIVAHLAGGDGLMGGANGPGAIAPAILLVVLWLAAWLRRPSLFQV
jgi:hypothetical protein